jgi:hypothetical protein
MQSWVLLNYPWTSSSNLLNCMSHLFFNLMLAFFASNISQPSVLLFLLLIKLSSFFSDITAGLVQRLKQGVLIWQLVKHNQQIRISLHMAFYFSWVIDSPSNFHDSNETLLGTTCSVGGKYWWYTLNTKYSHDLSLHYRSSFVHNHQI